MKFPKTKKMDNPTTTQKEKGRPPRPRYEFTLAEFPIAFFSKNARQKLKDVEIFEYTDTIRGRNGKPVQRKWRIIPAAGVGWGGPTTIGTLYELLQLWHEQGFGNHYINFRSIYHLIERKYLKTKSGDNYRHILHDLDVLSKTTFDAENAAYNPEADCYESIRSFRLFGPIHLFHKEPGSRGHLPFSYIEVADEFWRLVNKKTLFPLGANRDFFHSLKPDEQRLYLYLEKVFRSQSLHRKNLLTFARQFPILSDNPKSIKDILRRAAKGLKEKGYDRLHGCRFEKSADGKGWNVAFCRTGTLELPFRLHKSRRSPQGAKKKEPYQVEGLVEDMLEALGDRENRVFYALVARKLPSTAIHRFLSEIRLEARETEIRNKGAVFTVKVKRYAQEQGIDLGLKEPKKAQRDEKREEEIRAPVRSQERPKRVPAEPSQDLQEERRRGAEERELEASYQALSPENQAEVAARAEALLPDFLRKQKKLAEYKGEESYGVAMSLKAHRHMILKEMMREQKKRKGAVSRGRPPERIV